jgi:DNA primase
MPDLYNSLMERLEGRQYGHYFSACCPFHGDSKPSLLVFADGWFKCLGCNENGNHAKLDRKIGSHFIPVRQSNTVSRILPRWRGWEEKYGDLEGIADAAHRSLKSNSPFQTYFKRRKIYEFMDEGHLGCLDGWITFPVLDRNRNIQDIVVRSISKHSDVRYVLHPRMGNLRPIYVPSWKKIEENETIYVTYGIVDAISLHLAGLPVVTGITGKSLNAEILKPLGKRFIIVPDEGEEREAHRLANSLGWRARVKELDYPEECKDPDNIRRKFGNEYLLQALGA